MKKVEQFVKELGREELEAAAIEKFDMMIYEVEETLHKINRYVRFEKEESLVDLFKKMFTNQKNGLLKLDLWNPKYDEDYKLAIKGEYNGRRFVISTPQSFSK